MALRFIESFDHYPTANLGTKWNMVGTTYAIGATGRNGSNAFRTTGNTAAQSALGKAFDSQSTWSVGFAFKIEAAPGGSVPVVTLFDTVIANAQCSLTINADRTLAVCRGTSTAITGATSTNVIATNTWYYVEWLVTISDSISAGTCLVNVDGVNWITVPATSDTKALTTSTASVVRWVGCNNTATNYDDIYICDGSGGLIGPFGNTMVTKVLPDSDGTFNEWVASAGSRYACVNEASADGDTSYCAATTSASLGITQAANGLVQTFGLANLGWNPAAISGIQWNCALRKEDAGAYLAQRVLRSNATTATGTNLAIPTNYVNFTECFETDPCDSNAAWTVTKINNLEIGAKCVEIN